MKLLNFIFLFFGASLFAQDNMIGDLDSIESCYQYNLEIAKTKSIFKHNVIYVANFNYYNTLPNTRLNNFVERNMQYALDVEALVGVRAELLLAHSYVISDGETSYLANKGNNLFNLMFWDTSNKDYKSLANSYMMYDNTLDSFVDFGMFLNEVRNESKFTQKADIDIIVEIFYAKPKNAKKLKKTIKQIKNIRSVVDF